jgi:RND superfamily putative drug exporter
MFNRIARVVANQRAAQLIIIVWLALAAASFVAPKPQTSSQQQDFLPASDDSIVAAHIANNPAKYPRTGAQLLPMLIVFRDANGLSAGDISEARRVSDYLGNPAQRPTAVAGVSSIFIANNVSPGARLPADPRFLSSDGRTLTLTVLFAASGNDNALITPVKQVEDFLKSQSGGSPSLETGVSGAAALVADSSQAFKNLNGTVTVAAIILVIVLLLLIYRSPILPFVPLLAVGLAYLVSAALFGVIAKGLNLIVNPQSTSLAIVLILGAGTDYTLFIVSRYREELRQNESQYTAMWHTMTNIGEAIASSALIVVVTLLLLLLASLKFFSNLGPSAALAIACMLVAGLTFVPAVLALLGRRAFWPFQPRYGEEHAEDSGFWGWVAGVVSRRPAVVLGVTAAIFVALALGTLGLKQRYDFVSNFPTSYPSRQGQAILEKAGPADIGKLSPTQVYVTSSGSILGHLSELTAIANALVHTNGVQTVNGFAGSPPPTAQQIQQRDAALPPSQRAVSADGKTALITVDLNQDPYGTAAMDIIPAIRQSARAAVRGSGLQINVGGETALDTDSRSDTTRDIELLGPIIFLAIGIILALLLRSLVAPLYLLATTLLSYLATLGLTSLVFQHLLHETGIQNFVPPFMAVFLIALGADYNVFIMSRIREESHRIGIHDGTRKAIARTGGVITSAGLILAGTFAVLLVPPLEFLKQIGFAVAAGVLLDTFIIRALMVPSIVFLLDRWNWWPSSASVKQASRPAVPQAVVD